MASQSQNQSAADKALAVTELREAIISRLPCKDVLLAQRVSKSWQATIEGSSILQRALGLMPNNSSFITPSEWDQGWDELKRPTFPSRQSATHFLEASEKSHAYIINPLVERLFPKDPDYKDLFLIPNPNLKNLCRDEQSSWNKIYLTQPPVTGVSLGWRCACEGEVDEHGLSDYSSGVENPEGVTFADLVVRLLDVRRGNCRNLSAFCWRS